MVGGGGGRGREREEGDTIAYDVSRPSKTLDR